MSKRAKDEDILKIKLLKGIIGLSITYIKYDAENAFTFQNKMVNQETIQKGELELE